MPGFDKMGSYQTIDSTEKDEPILAYENQPVDIDDVEGMYLMFSIINI